MWETFEKELVQRGRCPVMDLKHLLSVFEGDDVTFELAFYKKDTNTVVEDGILREIDVKVIRKTRVD